MSRRHYDLPPLTALAAFEAAARLLSFKDAARELGVTPGAVSHQIRGLEAELGLRLFDRRHRGVALTEAGHDLSTCMQDAFSNVSATLQRLRGPQGVTVGSTSAVSSLWLAPAVARFWRENGEIAVHQVTSDHGFQRSIIPDIFIRYGPEDRKGWNQTPLFRDQLHPVGSPDHASGDMPLDKLATQRLIHLESDDRSWTTWPDWFRALGYDGPIASGIRVNNYTIALQAAREGAGIVLGWQRLIQPLLARGLLVPLGRHSLAAPHRFHLISRTGADLSPDALLLRDFLLRDVAIFSHEVNSPDGEDF